MFRACFMLPDGIYMYIPYLGQQTSKGSRIRSPMEMFKQATPPYLMAFVKTVPPVCGVVVFEIDKIHIWLYSV